MLVIEQKRHGISFKTVWYAEEKIRDKGIISYREAQFEGKKDAHPFATLTSDLTLPEEEITAKFSKNCRNLANRAPREGAECRFYGEKVTEEQIREFVDFFANFWESKEVDFPEAKKKSLTEEMLQYANKGALCISTAMLEDKAVVYHTYICDKSHARLWHSASLYRYEDARFSNIVGMANRYLHKEDMLAFKKQGVSVYDWGGAGTTEEVIKITEFKKSFGGTPALYYHFEEIRGIKARLFRLAAKIMGK